MSSPERRVFNGKWARWRDFVHFAHVGLCHLQAHLLFRVNLGNDFSLLNRWRNHLWTRCPVPCILTPGYTPPYTWQFWDTYSTCIFVNTQPPIYFLIHNVTTWFPLWSMIYKRWFVLKFWLKGISGWWFQRIPKMSRDWNHSAKYKMRVPNDVCWVLIDLYNYLWSPIIIRT